MNLPQPALRVAFLSIVPLLFAMLCADGMAADFYVSARQGEGTNPGTKERPVATLEQARSLVRSAKKNPGETVSVWIGEGSYSVGTGFELGPEDSGSEGAPVVWRAEKKGSVFLLGAKLIAADKFKPVTDPAVLERLDPEARGKVVQLDLAAEGVQRSGPFPDYFGSKRGIFEVFSSGQRLPLSRWPNGELGYSTMASVTDSGGFGSNDSHGGTFIYREDRPARWIKALQDGGVWVRGFWRVPWTLESLRVASIDPEKKSITLAVSTSGGIGSKYSKGKEGQRPGDGKEPWYALNLIEEIDQPGEWAINFKTKILYLWPISNGPVQIADEPGPVVLLKEAHHVVLRDLVVEASMGDGVRMEEGFKNLLAGCTIRNVNGAGVILRGGTGHQILSNDISETGLSGIDFTGGDRKTLTPGGHQIVNNQLFRVCRFGPMPALAAGLGTRQQVVGNRVANNQIHDVPNAGINFAGNDNIFELNEIFRIAMDSGDTGTFYTTGGWTSRGNIVRYNFVHHSENANGFYMDDGDSGCTVTGNIAYKVDSAGFVGGGHDHQIENNIFIDCARAIHADARGISRKYTATDPRLRGDLDSVPYQSPPWSEKYPQLVGILETDPSIPHGVMIQKNLFVACAQSKRLGGKSEEVAGITVADNEETPDLGIFENAETFDFRVKAGTPILTALPELKSIPFDKIGLFKDEYRTTVPERDLKLLREGDTKRRKFDSKTDMDASNKKTE